MRASGDGRITEEGLMRREDDLGPDDAERARAADHRPTGVPERAGIAPRHVLIALSAVLLLVFAVANFKPVDVNFLLFQSRARVITVVVVAGALGFLLGWLVGRPSRDERRYLRKRDDRTD
jgi:uncharacterized integral membrane protein